MVEPRLSQGGEAQIAGIADRDQHIAQKPGVADAFDRRASEERAEIRLVQRHEMGKRRRDEIGARLQFRLMRQLSEFVPGANGEAIVAAIDAIADFFAQFARNLALGLDGP